MERQMDYTKDELLLAQVRTYLDLAKRLRSRYYLQRAKVTIELYRELITSYPVYLAA